jgi:O-antigen biosynthesis protein
MLVSFILPLYGALPLTRECLRTLRSTLPPGLTHEIIMVDDLSPDGTRDWLSTLSAPCRLTLNECNLGFAGACNRGAATATGELLFFLNNDLVFLPGWFEPMQALLAAPDIGLAGNLQLNHRTGTLDHAGIAFDAKGKPAHETTIPLLARLRGWREVPALTGACLALRRDVWLRLGGFDEAFRNGGEDVDLALRARRIGLRNRVSVRSVVRHHVSASLGRKLRDEQNSRRLATLWRADIAVLAAPAWSAHYLDRAWHGPHDPRDYGLAAEALAVALGFRRSPSAPLLVGVGSALEAEFIRWQRLLDGAPAAKPDESLRTDQL